ncbi:MAG: distal tail protein Dit [Clostridium sp.]|uniref:distal tail protein Dit n=1 Tax=Romboutsia timonensis TaxID=1776391 RepID=UPI0039A00615
MDEFITNIVFNNINSSKDLGLAITDMANIPVANETIEMVNGYIIRTGEYLPIELPITFRSKNLKNIIDRQEEILDWLYNVKDNKLILSFMPNRYYIVKNVVVDNISRDFDKYNTISVTFTLEPFKYDIYDKTMILTKSEKIYYMGNAKGKPKLKIYGSGNIELTINSETIQIKNIDEYVELDSKFLLCLNKNQQSKSRDMSGGFPILTKGINNISWTGNVTKIELLKRTAYL